MSEDRRFVRNPGGQIHSVDNEHYRRLQVEAGGRLYLQPGWEDVDEATAREEIPAEFGLADANVTAMMTPPEIRAALDRKRAADEINGPVRS